MHGVLPTHGHVHIEFNRQVIHILSVCISKRFNRYSRFCRLFCIMIEQLLPYSFYLYKICNSYAHRKSGCPMLEEGQTNRYGRKTNIVGGQPRSRSTSPFRMTLIIS